MIQYFLNLGMDYLYKGPLPPLRIGDNGPDAFTKFFRYIGDLEVSKQLRTTKWHISTLLNTFNTYYCYDIHPTHVKEIMPIHINGRGRLMAIELVLGKTQNDDTFMFYFDNTLSIDICLLGELRDQFKVEGPMGLFFIEPVVYIHELPSSSYAITYMVTNSTRFGAPPLRRDITNLFMWHVNLKYVSPARITRNTKWLENPVLPLETNDYIYILRFLFGSTLAYIEENFEKYYATRSTIEGPPLSYKKESLVYHQLDENERRIIAKTALYSMDQYEIKLQSEEKVNTRIIDALATVIIKATASIQKMMGDAKVKKELNEMEMFFMGDKIDEPDSTTIREEREQRIYKQYKLIDEYTKLIDNTTNEIKKLISLLDTRVTPDIEKEVINDSESEEEEEEESYDYYDDEDIMIPIW